MLLYRDTDSLYYNREKIEILYDEMHTFLSKLGIIINMEKFNESEDHKFKAKISVNRTIFEKLIGDQSNNSNQEYNKEEFERIFNEEMEKLEKENY